MLIKLKGNSTTRRVWLNGKELFPERSQAVHNHSPDGFNWGYGGSGPAQLALAICLELWPITDDVSWNSKFNYQQFKFKYIAALPVGKDFEVEIDVIPYPYKPTGTLDV